MVNYFELMIAINIAIKYKLRLLKTYKSTALQGKIL